MSRRFALPVLSVALLSAAAWLPAPSDAQDDAPSEFEQQRARFHGTWELTTPMGDARQRVDRAIEQTVEAMNFFVRSVARGQLRDNTPLNRRIVLRFHDDERITVHFSETDFRATTRVGRTGRARTASGDAMRVTQRFRGEVLEQVFQTDEGTRWNTYTKTGDDTLRVDATTQGMMMPEAMRFALEYRRAD